MKNNYVETIELSVVLSTLYIIVFIWELTGNYLKFSNVTIYQLSKTPFRQLHPSRYMLRCHHRTMAITVNISLAIDTV